LPSDLENFAKFAEKNGGAALIADNEQTSLHLNARPNQDGKAQHISLSSDREGSTLYLFGSKTLAFLGVHDFSKIPGPFKEPEFASLELSQSPSSDSHENIRKPQVELKFDGKRQVELRFDADGRSDLEFSQGFKRFARLAVDTQGSPAFSLYDGGGEPRAQLSFMDKEGDPIFYLGKAEGPSTSLSQDGLFLIDEKRKLRAALGRTTLEKARNGVTETTAPGSLTLFDKHGRVMWQAPDSVIYGAGIRRGPPSR
jgi:hypothetical protein